MSSGLEQFARPLIGPALGAVFIGFAVACVEYGIVLLQVYNYFHNYPLDKPLYKYVVVLIVLVDTADQILMGHFVYYYAVQHWADWDVLLSASMLWSLVCQVLLGSLVGTIVKTYFSLRVWRFSGCNIWITGFILLLTYGQMALSIVFAVKSFALSSLFEARDIKVLGTICLGTGVLTDIVVAVTLCYCLNKLRTGYKSSDSLVNLLCRYAINTGVFTSAVSLTTVLLYNLTPDTNLMFIAFYFVLSKLYAISFLATLNTRRQVRGRGTEQEGATTNHTNMFHLGTRVPSLGPNDFDGWDKVTPSVPEFSPRSPVLSERGRSILDQPMQVIAKDEFPYNSFAPATQQRSFGTVPGVSFGQAV